MDHCIEERNIEERKPEKHTVLVVDDEQSVLDVFEAMLSTAYHVRTARSAEMALGMVDSGEFREKGIDLFVLDLCMGGIDGVNFYGIMREQHKIYAPALLVTGFDPGSAAPRFKRMGGYAVLRKPVLMGELLNASKRAIENYPTDAHH